MPIYIYDNIKIAIQILSSSQYTEIQNIQWHQPIIQPIPKIPKQLSRYDDKKILEKIDKNRLNEIAIACAKEEQEIESFYDGKKKELNNVIKQKNSEKVKLSTEIGAAKQQLGAQKVENARIFATQNEEH